MNENEIIVAGGNLPAATGQMSVPQLKEQVQVIQLVLRDVMKKGTHFDALPGCGEKPVLLKAGAEKIGMVFRIGSEPEVDREFDGFDTHFHIRCRMFDIRTGNTLGYGVGEGSTSESKWAWRRAVCHEEFEAAMETRRRIHWQRKYRGEGFEAVEQVRQNPSDIINTVLKMACKRAEVDGIRKVTACSDVFDQDLDEDHIRAAVGEEPAEPRYQQPQRKAATPPPESNPAPTGNIISDAQLKRLFAIANRVKLTDKEIEFICYDIGRANSPQEVTRNMYEAVISAIEAATPGAVIPQ